MRLDLLLEAINKKREEMIKTGLEKGLLCEETIHCSQELDKLLNCYQNLLLEGNYSKSSRGKSPLTQSFPFLQGLSQSLFFV